MIRKLTEQDREQVLKYLYQEPALNIFTIGDIENFGFDVDYQDVYADIIDGQYDSVLLRYRKNILYYCHETRIDKDWITLIKELDFEFISGRKSLTDLILPYFSDLKEKPMYFCEADSFDPSFDIKDNKIIDIKTKDDIALMFDLLKSIEEFDSMKSENKEKFIENKLNALKHSKSYMIKEDGLCVSTVSTVADTTTAAMVVAVATNPLYRGKGYASSLMKHLLKEYLINRKKSLCLFYDNPAAGKIYHRLGFVDKDMWVMLVRK